VKRFSKKREGERGITILLVAIAMISILAMAALAVDIVALYVARAETQRAADAAALAAAKMFAFSGYTSNSSIITQSELCVSGGGGSSAAANQAAQSAVSQNRVVGQVATIQAITCDFSQPENPRVTVTVQRAGLPTFFARIWRAGAGSVSTTASAEAFNPSGGTVNIAVGSVKPWLIPNCLDATCASGNYFTNTYRVANSGNFIGTTQTFQRMVATNNTPGPLPPTTPPGQWWYYALDPPPPNVCPSSGALSCNQVGSGGPGADYRDNISCSNTAFQYSCGQQIAPGQPVQFNSSPGGSLFPRTIEGITCLIHASSSGTANSGQDTISLGFPGSPVIITGGVNNPNSALQNTTNISRSDSVVTVPVYAGSNACPTSSTTCSATVTGFLQLGIQDVTGGGQFDAVIMNAAPCDPANSSGTPVVGGAVSPIPVRLIQ
jgi:putative Flp pilus-assembly TadE/G-like protein